MVAACGCLDPTVWGHKDVCERELGPPAPSSAHTPTSPKVRYPSPDDVPEITDNRVRHWYDRVIAWSTAFDRRYSELKAAELEMHGRVL